MGIYYFFNLSRLGRSLILPDNKRHIDIIGLIDCAYLG